MIFRILARASACTFAIAAAMTAHADEAAPGADIIVTGHGFGLRPKGATSDHWFAGLVWWMQSRGLMPPARNHPS